MTSRHVNSIAGRLSLRSPQRTSLEILDRVMEIAQPHKLKTAGGDLESALDVIRSEFPTVEDFEHAFPSLCFALATGVGKTRLMGAFITYLHLEHGIRHFFVLAPNLTIYNKLLTDFTPNTPKYVFQGISEFVLDPPEIITGDNYESGRGVRRGRLFDEDVVHINIFNISKINSEVRGGFQLRVRIGPDDGTNLVLGAETIPEIGQRAFIGLSFVPRPRWPMAVEVHVTDQPVNEGELAVRGILEVGRQLTDTFALSLRASYQGRSIDHAGLGAGLALTFDW